MPPQPAMDPFGPEPLAGRRIALGVSGSIAAIKAPAIVSELVRSGALVDVLLTRSGAEFVRPLAFQALTHRSVASDLWDPNGPTGMDHVAIANAAELLVIAPATADLIARLAQGRADDVLTTTALATTAPLIIAPAMEPRMWRHPATAANVRTLTARGAIVLGPVEGRTASGASGIGRMVEPELIVEYVRATLGRAGPLAGRRVLVSSGPTQEAIDPVRYLGNRSSGRMGLALARAARDAGAAVTLIFGPTSLPTPVGIHVIPVTTAAEMSDRVIETALADEIDILVMAAAVADYRPRSSSPTKIKKGDDLQLALECTDDILLELDLALQETSFRPIRVGFAAETNDLLGNARAKLERKNLDLVVANIVPASFGDSQVEATLVTLGEVDELTSLSKRALAGEIMRRANAMLQLRTEVDSPELIDEG